MRWRIVPNWPRYSISDEGRVFSRYSNSFLTPSNDWMVVLYHKGQMRGVGVGRLVLETFVGPCPEGMECCHYDDNRANNSLSNLRWDTRSANILDSYRNGRSYFIEPNKHTYKILTKENINEAKILRLLSPKYWTWKKLGERYGVTLSAIAAATKRRN